MELVGAPPSCYAPSGRVGLRMVPLVALGLVVALGMAVALLVVGDAHWLYVLTPCALGLPVLGAMWAVIRWGHCRSPKLGVATCVVLALVYYLGYWAISYEVHVVAYGAEAVQRVEVESGLPGALGWFVFSAHHTTVRSSHQSDDPERARPNATDPYLNYLFHALEAALLLGFAWSIGGAGSRRVYDERLGRWAKAWACHFRPGDLAAAVTAARAGDWRALAGLPRLPVELGSKGRTSGGLFTVEHFADAGLGEPSPVHLSLLGHLIPKEVVARAGGEGMHFFRQLRVEPGDAAGLLEAFREELGLGVVGAKPSAWRASLGVARRGSPRFDEAVERGARALAEARVSDPRHARVSTCLRVPAEERRIGRWAARLQLGVALLLGALFAGGMAVGIVAEGHKIGRVFAEPWGRVHEVSVGVGVPALFALILWLVVGGWVQTKVVRRALAARPGSLLAGASELRHEWLWIHDVTAYATARMRPLDVTVCAIDPRERRLLFEGLDYRLVVRADDVTRLEPLEANEAFMAVDLAFTAAGVPLHLVLYRSNLGRAFGAHLGGSMAKGLDRLTHALGAALRG